MVSRGLLPMGQISSAQHKARGSYRQETACFLIANDLLLRRIEAHRTPNDYEALAKCTSVVEMWASSIGEEFLGATGCGYNRRSLRNDRGTFAVWPGFGLIR